MREMVTVSISRIPAAISVTASARRTRSLEMLRLNATMEFSPRTVMRTARKITAMVVTFTPPPVEAGDAPVNISKLATSLPAGRIAASSMVLKPAVRSVTDWNSAASSFSPRVRFPSVAGLLHSEISVNTKPKASRMP